MVEPSITSAGVFIIFNKDGVNKIPAIPVTIPPTMDNAMAV